jgi:hypothetical protein
MAHDSHRAETRAQLPVVQASRRGVQTGEVERVADACFLAHSLTVDRSGQLNISRMPGPPRIPRR